MKTYLNIKEAKAELAQLKLACYGSANAVIPKGMGVPFRMDIDMLEHAITEFYNSNKTKILKIVWDEAGGYPKHALGFTQYSLRPFEQRDGCDGTIDDNVHYIAFKLCEQVGLDYLAIYQKAYHREDSTYLKQLKDDEFVKNDTIVPKTADNTTLSNMLYDLTSINNHSVCDLLAKILISKGCCLNG